jgi:hypothetical protein
MSIAAALNGTFARVLLAAGDSRKCGIRPIDGRPPSGWNGDFFYGVYFAGFSNDSSQMLESWEKRYRVGVDITFKMGAVPGRKQGPFALQESELLDRVEKLPLYLMDGVKILTAANAARSTPLTGQFFEAFDSVECGRVEMKGGEWIGGMDSSTDGEGAERGGNKAPTIMAVSLTFSGLKWGQTLLEFPDE